jgi:hypothetical protein
MLEIALTLLRLGAAESMRSAGRRLGVALVCGLLAATAAATAAGCIMAAAWLALLPAIGPIWTPLLLAAILAGLSAVLVVALRQSSGRRPWRGEPNSVKNPFAALSALAGEHGNALVLGALLAGLLAGGRLGRFRH